MITITILDLILKLLSNYMTTIRYLTVSVRVVLGPWSMMKELKLVMILTNTLLLWNISQKKGLILKPIQLSVIILVIVPKLALGGFMVHHLGAMVVSSQKRFQTIYHQIIPFLELGKETHQTWKKSTHHQTHGYVSRASSEDDNDIFVADIAFVEAVNENVKSTWKAKVHQQFVGKKMKHMHKLLGRRRFQRHLKIGRARVEPTPALLTEQEIVESDQLPEKWDWRNVSGINYLTPVRNQGSCGSCYAMSALAMFESRLKISSPELGFIQLSPQDVLSCSSFNQGCDGGYPYLVAKFGAEYSLTEESCLPYTETDSIQCESEKDQGSCYKRYTVQDYHYVGGFYGGCNEYSMMKELMENGPIAVALHAPGSLLYYQGGIFDNQMMSWDKEKKKMGTNESCSNCRWLGG